MSQSDSQSSASFAETALRLGGKSEEEARRTGAVDRADEQVDKLFAPQYQTVNSPVHRAVWDKQVDAELFWAPEPKPDPQVQKVMDQSLEVVRRHLEQGTAYDQHGKVSPALLDDLAQAGYWGLLVPRQYQGSGASFSAFAAFLTRMATVDATVAGLASVHGCIGAVDPLCTFGSPEQKERFLPLLATGKRLSGFALTEPGAGSDLTALRTVAVRQGDQYLLRGEKLFITNAIPGRLVAVVCLIEGKPAVLIVDLPPQENEQFRLRRYGLYALRRTWNNGLIFNDLPVPVENLLVPRVGDGLTIAYHGLNRGRVALCATAAGSMRVMLASMIPWVKFRRTYGAPIGTRELVQRRLALVAGLIVASDALVRWGASLLDRGYRGEMECIVAKIFGSEAQKEAAIEYLMKTHGGRSFLHGHMFGDNVHEFLAPCIYEGEGEMLGMAFFKSLVKDHGVRFFQPVGEALQRAGIRRPNMLNPRHLWVIRGPLTQYALWQLRFRLRPAQVPALTELPAPLREHVHWAARFLRKMALELSATMRRYQLKLADRQNRIAELSARAQKAVVVLCTALYAGRQSNPLVREAGDVICQHLKMQLEGRRPSDRFFRQVRQLGEAIVEEQFPLPEDIPQAAKEILMPYEP